MELVRHPVTCRALGELDMVDMTNSKEGIVPDLETIFYAGLVHRWHTNPRLAGTVDRLDGHQARVARIIIALWPDASRDLILAALTHDDGEYITGDVPAPAGKTPAQVIAELKAWRSVWGREWPGRDWPDLDPLDKRRLHFADKLDAFQWAEHHAPEHVMMAEEWVRAHNWLLDEAEELGVAI